MKLYSYWRSSAAYRVRIGLNLKQVTYETVPIHLLRDGGEQLKPAYRKINPNALVPALELDDGNILTQSLAILDYFEETHSEPPLLPRDPLKRARIRAAAQIIALDVHPINNLRILTYLKSQEGLDQDHVKAWAKHWMHHGLTAYAAMIEPGVRFSFGDAPTLADVCLIPQLYNARRWHLDLQDLPRLLEIEAACNDIPAFAAAAPERQPDAE
ncbi:maleylacetoacetate isomerase [Methylovirgula sp. 4M-Z18]|uniref:maleylacetoacetate isomerase n=1 Tax=Methylovirgula sp. 4M-Z18 TaxID=2293567 RepID=UPI000E2E8380|nr:maleylacetoacetate isomerase [Methylovirgula sp. 4M-Z18]RFB78362.1 maleylacetoacetate isomerase [Methylovirgula sp. 4M-Z18]